MPCDAVPKAPRRIYVEGNQAESSYSISAEKVLPNVECVVPALQEESTFSIFAKQVLPNVEGIVDK